MVSGVQHIGQQTIIQGAEKPSLAQLVERWVSVSAGHGQLPLVRDVGLDQLRVHAARVPVSYIERDQQAKLEEAIGPGLAVLVVGHSMSGKTRLVAEVVKRKFPEALLVAAESGKGLRELVDGGLDPAGLVIWLDDLEWFLGADGLTLGLLNRLITGRAIVVATIRRKERDTYRPSDELRELRPAGWEVLHRFSEISLQRRLSSPELSRVRATVNDPGVLAAVDHYGLAEYLGAGPDAVDKFDEGEIVSPVGQALVRAAVDWSRTGLNRPISYEVLTKSLPTYLADRPDVPRTKHAIQEGLAWATAKINETVALLGQIFTDSNRPVYKAFEYLVDQLTSTRTPVLGPMWSLALEQAEPAELVVIGIAAYQTNNSATAVTAWRQAADKGDSWVAPQAAYNLGVLLAQQGDVQDAKVVFQQALASGHVESAPMAATTLGVVLEAHGDMQGAKVAYQQALATGHAEWAPKAAFNLGTLLAKQGDMQGAKVAFQQALASGHTDQAPMAAANLGLMLAKHGDVKGAKVAFQQALASGHADAAPRAAVILGVVLEAHGDVQGARVAFQQAIASGHAEWAPKAARNLEQLLRSTPPPAAP